MKQLVKVTKALADGNRLRILRLLMERPRCVCELQQALGITQPSVSKHLRILEEAGLVDKERNGQFIDYRLAPFPDPVDPRGALLSQLLDWLQQEPELQAFARRADQIDRRQILRKEPKVTLAAGQTPEL